MESTNRLQFVISLLDRVTGPLDNMQNRFAQFSDRAEAGFTKVGMGAAGLAGSVISVGNVLASGNDFMAGLGEVKSLSVAQDALDSLEKQSLAFASRYNVNAADVVRSSYDIQSAISGLQGDQLAKFTVASNVLAKATKSDAGTITSYVGTMYGIFQQQAEKMGKGEWVDMLAGQTATAVQLFKTTGPKMADAFSAVGAAGTAMGASLSEQMAILGTLQSTMEGGEAGTKYRAFLKGIGNAQKELGLRFTDTQGKMLPMVDILQAIKGKYGAIDTVAESDKLQKAFGSDEAVALVKLLSVNIDGLSGSMQQLGEVQGIGKASAMAEAMLTPMDRLKGSSAALYTRFSLLMNGAVSPLVSKLDTGSTKLAAWLEMFPDLGKWVAYATLGVMGLIAGVSVFAILGGIATLTTAGWAAACGVASGAMGFLNIVLGAGRVAMLLFSSALWANPITWMVAGVIALVAVCALLWFKWDVLKQAFLDTSWGQAIVGGFQQVGLWLTAAGNWFDGLGVRWDAFIAKISNLSPLEALKSALSFLSTPFKFAADVVGSVAGGFSIPGITDAAPVATGLPASTVQPFQVAGLSDAMPAPVTKPDKLSGTAMPAPVALPNTLPVSAMPSMQSPVMPVAKAGVAPQQLSIPGGAGKQVAHAINTNTNNNGMRIGEMHIHTSKPITPDEISHLAQFSA